MKNAIYKPITLAKKKSLSTNRQYLHISWPTRKIQEYWLLVLEKPNLCFSHYKFIIASGNNVLVDLSPTSDDINDIITTTRHNPTQVFLLRYTFQATVHSIWRERNSRRHGEQPCDANSLTKFVEKKAPLIMLSVQGKGYKHLDEGYTNLVWDMVTRFSYNMKLKHIF